MSKEVPTVLICDDDRDLASLISSRLKEEGFEPSVVYNGTEALRLVNEQKPDLVILDGLVPGMHGFDVCKAIKSQKETKHIAVILATAIYKKSRYRQEAIQQMGAQDYLIKPFEMDELVAKVKRILRK